MKLAIRYYSRGGNTKRLAEAISSAVGVEAKPVSQPLTEDVDILFLGSSPYAFDVDDEVKKFISGITVSVGKAVNFSTSASLRSTKKYVEKLLAAKNIPMSDEEFSCPGSFAFLHKGRPNETDLTSAATFAKKLIS